MIGEVDKDVLQALVTKRTERAIVAMLAEHFPHPAITENPAINAGVLYGIADVLVNMVGRTAKDPDAIAKGITDYITMQVAYRTSKGDG